jgi:hypothetical protein
MGVTSWISIMYHGCDLKNLKNLHLLVLNESGILVPGEGYYCAIYSYSFHLWNTCVHLWNTCVHLWNTCVICTSTYELPCLNGPVTENPVDFNPPSSMGWNTGELFYAYSNSTCRRVYQKSTISILGLIFQVGGSGRQVFLHTAKIQVSR